MFGHSFSSEAGNTAERGALPVACLPQQLRKHIFSIASSLSLSDISFFASYDCRKSYLSFGGKNKCSLGLRIATGTFKMHNHRDCEGER